MEGRLHVLAQLLPLHTLPHDQPKSLADLSKHSVSYRQSPKIYYEVRNRLEISILCRI